MPSLLESPLIRMVLRPTSTKSCGNDFNAFTGEFGDNSPFSYPPGNVSTLPSNNHIATAAGATGGVPSFNSTPSSNASFPINSKSAGFSSLSRSSNASMTLARVSLALPPICFTCPKSIRPMRPSSSTKMFPGCGLKKSQSVTEYSRRTISKNNNNTIHSLGMKESSLQNTPSKHIRQTPQQLPTKQLTLRTSRIDPPLQHFLRSSTQRNSL
mmetsp:Transcript_15878/g.34323  ORF Transcript_15878/g.34323 Transcript_15878/m.34323 type:complete len:212 (-) Transcript_15878:1061-1696(-)